jgi:hypothetical protein
MFSFFFTPDPLAWLEKLDTGIAIANIANPQPPKNPNSQNPP